MSKTDNNHVHTYKASAPPPPPRHTYTHTPDHQLVQPIAALSRAPGGLEPAYPPQRRTICVALSYEYVEDASEAADPWIIWVCSCF